VPAHDRAPPVAAAPSRPDGAAGSRRRRRRVGRALRRRRHGVRRRVARVHRSPARTQPPPARSDLRRRRRARGRRRGPRHPRTRREERSEPPAWRPARLYREKVARGRRMTTKSIAEERLLDLALEEALAGAPAASARGQKLLAAMLFLFGIGVIAALLWQRHPAAPPAPLQQPLPT